MVRRIFLRGTTLFRPGCVSLRDSLCGVALFMPIGYYASAQSLDSLAGTKNRDSRKLNKLI
jgi:hypothetical protein